MIIGNKEYKEIQIITDDNELIASITDEDVVEKKGYKVVCVPDRIKDSHQCYHKCGGDAFEVTKMVGITGRAMQRNLEDVKTCDLVDALKHREGIEVIMADPYKEITVPVNGPAIALVVTD